MSDCRIANSSPPSRLTVSTSRTHAFQPFRHRPQQFVADGVAERVVHLLEMIEIEVQYCKAAAVAAELLIAFSIRSANRTRFGSPVNDVVPRHEDDALLGAAALGHVLVGRDPAAIAGWLTARSG